MTNNEQPNDFTGYWGIWNERSKTFVLGIQEKSKWYADKALNMRIGTKQSYRKPHWRAKRIRAIHAPMFYGGLKFKNGKGINK